MPKYLAGKLLDLDKHLLKTYGITLDEYEWLFVVNDGRCYSCGQASKNRLCVDHDHTNGHIRGLLCSRCNLLMNYLFDNPKLVENMLLYANSRKKPCHAPSMDLGV